MIQGELGGIHSQTSMKIVGLWAKKTRGKEARKEKETAVENREQDEKKP